jgi:hypothetical protein
MLGSQLSQETCDKVRIIKERISATQSRGRVMLITEGEPWSSKWGIVCF